MVAPLSELWWNATTGVTEIASSWGKMLMGNDVGGQKVKKISKSNEQTGLEMIMRTQSPAGRAQPSWALGKWRQ